MEYKEYFTEKALALADGGTTARISATHNDSMISHGAPNGCEMWT